MIGHYRAPSTNSLAPAAPAAAERMIGHCGTPSTNLRAPVAAERMIAHYGTP